MNKLILETIGLAVMLISLMFYINGLKSSISDLTIANRDLAIEITHKNLEKERLENTLKTQNKEIEDARHNKNLAQAKLKKWKNLPPKIKYIHTPPIIREVKSNECDDIKKSITALRHLDFRSL